MQILEVVGNEPNRPTIVNHFAPNLVRSSPHCNRLAAARRFRQRVEHGNGVVGLAVVLQIGRAADRRRGGMCEMLFEQDRLAASAAAKAASSCRRSSRQTLAPCKAGQDEQLVVVGKPSAPVMPATPATPISSAAG